MAEVTGCVAESQPLPAPLSSSWALEYDFVLTEVGIPIALPQQSFAVGSVGCLLTSSCWSQGRRQVGEGSVRGRDSLCVISIPHMFNRLLLGVECPKEYSDG